MTMRIYKFIMVLFAIVLPAALIIAQVQKTVALGHGYDFEGNGKDSTTKKQADLYLLWNSLQNLEKALVEDSLVSTALQIQQNYLALKNREHQYGNLKFKDEKLLEVANKLIAQVKSPGTIGDFRLYRIEGEDGKGNVHFTAYYTPVINASREEDQEFKFPIYRKPDSWNGKRPTRAMIDDQKVLEGQGLEIAWTASLVENYFMHVQGSGYLRFEDGFLTLLQFNGQNGYPYTSIGKYLIEKGHIEAENISLPSIRRWFLENPLLVSQTLNINKSYSFFSTSDNNPRGAANTELVTGHTIAVDPSYIPFGSILLAKIPILDAEGYFSKHDYRIVTAQDRGGAIKGPGHVDLYEGVGDDAEKRAGFLHHYGSLWLILPTR